MNEGLWAIIGLVVGALLGLLPKLFDMYSSNARDKQEETADLRMMLAMVLVNCVNSTNGFLRQAARLRLDSKQPDRSDVTKDEVDEAVNLAFAMKTAWMHALVSFGDPEPGAKKNDKSEYSKVDIERRQVIRGMLSDLDKTYGIYQDGDRTSGQVIEQRQIFEQLQSIAESSRHRLQELLRLD